MWHGRAYSDLFIWCRIVNFFLLSSTSDHSPSSPSRVVTSLNALSTEPTFFSILDVAQLHSCRKPEHLEQNLAQPYPVALLTPQVILSFYRCHHCFPPAPYRLPCVVKSFDSCGSWWKWQRTMGSSSGRWTSQRCCTSVAARNKLPKVDGDCIPTSQKYHETSGISSNWMVFFSWPLFPVVELFSSNFLQCSHQTVW